MLRHGSREVVPLWDAAAEKTAIEICDRAGLLVKEVADVEPVRGSGALGWASDDLHPWADLYRRLTGREAVDDSYRAGAAADVMVVAPVDITPQLLIEVGALQSTGLLVVDSGDDPLSTVIGAKIARCRRPPGGGCILNPELERLERWFGEKRWHVVTGSAALADPGSERSLLVIATHSDGIDAQLGGQSTLCPRSSWGSDHTAPGERVPACVELRRCHRHNLPIDAPALGALAKAPDELNAFALVLAACHALRFAAPADHSIAWPDYRWSLMAATLRARKACVTAFGVGLHRESPDGYRKLVGDVGGGMRIGRAIAAENQRNPRGRLVLVGDPDISVPAPAVSAAPPVGRSNASPTDPSAPPPLSGRGTRFLAAYLNEAALNAVTGEQMKAATHAYSLATALQSQVDQRSTDRERVVSLHERLFSALLDYFEFRGVMISHDWQQLGAVDVLDGSESCVWCAAPSERWRYRFRNPALGGRYLVCCLRCGVVRDSWSRGPRSVETSMVGWRVPGRGPGEAAARQAAIGQTLRGGSRKAITRIGEFEPPGYLLAAIADEVAISAGLKDERAQGIYLEGGNLEISALPVMDSTRKDA